MKHYTVYILLCSDNSYYVGFTNDIDERVYQHNKGIKRTAYTFSRRPVKLVFEGHFYNAKQGIAFEKQVKGWRRTKKEALINREWNKLPELSKAYRDKVFKASKG